MTLPRAAGLSALLIAGAIALAGCSSSFFADGFGVEATATATAQPTPAPTSSESTSASPAPKESASPTPAIRGWSECPKIVADLNKKVSDPATYKQVEAAKFPVEAVGTETLVRSCVIAVTTNNETVYWAVLPGDTALASAVKTRLIDAGFTPTGVANSYGNNKTSEGALVSAFQNGAALDAFLVSPSAFARFTQSLVYVGAFFLS
jgi:hypothetical protein